MERVTRYKALNGEEYDLAVECLGADLEVRLANALVSYDVTSVDKFVETAVGSSVFRQAVADALNKHDTAYPTAAIIDRGEQ